MAQEIVRGNPITLTARFRDSSGNLADATNPTVSIVDPTGVTVVLLAIPTRQSVGVYTYVYPVAANATLGAWAAQWAGIIGGNTVADEDGFTVIATVPVSGPPPIGAGTHTVGQLVDRTLNTWLLGTYRALYNSLKLAIDAQPTTNEVQLTSPAGEVAVNSLLAIDDELMYVTDRDATNNRLVVVRGVRGTVPAAHAAASTIEVNPRFPRFLVREAFREEIDSWPTSLYRPVSLTVNLGAREGMIDLTTPLAVAGVTAKGIVQVRRLSLSLDDARYRRTDGYGVGWSLVGSDSLAVVLKRRLDIATTYSVVVAGDFLTDPFTDLTVLETEVGLRRSMCEVLELGAAYRLLYGRASVRLFPESEGQSRNAAEVGAHDIPIQAQGLLRMRDMAIAGAAADLIGRYGFGGL